MTSVGTFLVGILVFGCGPGPAPQSPGPRPDPAKPAPSPASSGTEDRFTGKITEINFGCARDASCDLVVDGTKHVHFGHDTRGRQQSEWGSADDLWTLMQAPDSGIGRTIEVFAATTDHVNFTIEGKTAYVIKLVP